MADERRGRSLAARFRRAHADREAARAAEEAERARREEAAKEAAAALLGELAAFGRELGFVEVRLAPQGVLLGHEGRELAMRHGDVAGQIVVAGSGADKEAFLGRIYAEDALGGKWVLAFQHRRQEVRLPLFDAGLEELLVHGLGLDRPA